ncbi:adenylosuccinate synthetase [Candidatus Gracilibacteria bacterium]|nr:adenylosuccinate synthetase [Candidatus Gracilibacteria bacterium]
MGVDMNNGSFTMGNSDFSKSRFIERRNDLDFEVSIGTQYGDEGKGKVTDILNQHPGKKLSVRFQGGHNAGHTLVVKGKKYAFHILPSGMLSEGTENLIMSSCVLPVDLYKVDLDKFSMTSEGIICNHSLDDLVKRDKDSNPLRVGLIPEMEKLIDGGEDVKASKLKVSGEVPMIGMINVLLDALDEKTLEYNQYSRPVGSTGSGISRAYASDDMRYHLRLNTLLYNEEAFYNALEQYWSKYQHFFPKIKPEDIINSAKKEKAAFEAYRDKGYVDVIDYEKEYIANKVEDGYKVIGEGAQSTMIGSDNSYFGTASSPSLELFLRVTGLDVKGLANLYLTHKFPTSSVGERPDFAKMSETEILRWFRRIYNEIGVSSGRDRDMFNPSLPELAQGNFLAYDGIDDKDKIVAVFNRVDGMEDMCKLTKDGLLQIITGYEFDDGRTKGGRKVGLQGNQIISPQNLLKRYPSKSDQLHLFNGVKPDFRKLYSEDLKDTIEKFLAIHLATIFEGVQEREFLIGTGPGRDDLELMKGSPLRQF